MSILIKGMDMPKCCTECSCCRHDNWNGETAHQCNVSLITFSAEDENWIYDQRPNWCPLVEIPTPHGRLIDADALIAKTRKLYCNNCILRTGTKNGKKQFVYEIGDAPCRGCWIDDMMTELQDAPTIIEAEGSDT